MPQPTGGKVNASNLNVEGLDEVVTPLGTDNLMLGRDGAQNEKVPLSAIASVVIPDPLLLSDGTEAAPSLAFTLDIDTGIYRDGANVLGITAGGAGVALFPITGITVEHVSGPIMINGPPSATTPTLIPNKTDDNTGIGRRGADVGTLIAGGFTVAEFFESSSNPQLILPQVNVAAAPTLAFGDGDTGIRETSDDTLQISIGGLSHVLISSTWIFRAILSNGPGMRAVDSTPTVPNVHPNRDDTDTGLGTNGADVGVLIAGGVNVQEWGEAGAAPLLGFFGTAAVAQPAAVPVTAAGIHAALVTLGLIT